MQSMKLASRWILAALAIALIGIHSTAAQQPKEPAVPMQPAAPKLDPKACGDRDRLPHADVPETKGSASDNESVSEKLARTDGVICPPAGLDPDIRAPAPGESNMPVIPPPGTPGGDPDVRPK